MPEITFAQVVQDLKDLLEPTLTRHIYGNTSVADAAARLRLAHRAATYLTQHESSDTIRQWFIGRGISVNGEEISPADAIRQLPPGDQTDELIMSAAHRLVDGTWD